MEGKKIKFHVFEPERKERKGNKSILKIHLYYFTTIIIDRQTSNYIGRLVTI